MKKLRFATLSAKGIADAHIRGILENENTELVAVCDVDPERLAQEKEAHPWIRTYTDFREVLACDDIVHGRAGLPVRAGICAGA